MAGAEDCPVFPVAYPFPLAQLQNEFENALATRQLIIDPEAGPFHGFYLLDPTPLAHEIANDFLAKHEIPFKKYIVNFLLIESGTSLPWHQDKQGSICAINVVINGNKDPVVFESGTYEYQAALIDVSRTHCVRTGALDRKLFRITFQDENARFEAVKKILTRPRDL